nr:putative glycolipid-binding domain-containing protein [Oceaniglobus trochenteri]
MATANWRRLDGQGDDKCRLVAEPEGYMLIGHARFVQAGVNAALDYVVRCDRHWHTTGADVTGTFGASALGWRFQRNGAWTVNGTAVPGTDDCIDIDLGFTPATNLLPLRRLEATLDQPQAVTALWLSWPAGRVQPLSQRYHRIDAQTLRYGAPGFDADLVAHPSGFVTHYPTGWDGTVDAP